MSKSLGFTMAEILLSLTIIGVVAAITLPSLMANINERTWNTQRKALYARMSQAIAMMPQLNGYGEYEGTNTDGSVTATKDTAAEAFLTEGLSKVLKINNICDAAHLADCGVAATYTNLAGSAGLIWPKKLSELNSQFTNSYINAASSVYQNPQSNVDTNAAAFETQNGETVVLYYNPYCVADFQEDDWHYSQPKMCANFIYDLNGNKGPNAVGKDIGFLTALYPFDSNVVAPNFLSTIATTSAIEYTSLNATCLAQDQDSRLPNRDELSALYYNRDFLGDLRKGLYGSASVSHFSGSASVWTVALDTGLRGRRSLSTKLLAHCVKR